MPPDRARVLDTLISQLRLELDAALIANQMAIDEATGEQSKAENQYDTRSLEASYLARGQSERIAALRGLLGFLEREQSSSPSPDRVGLGALVGLASDAGESWVFLVPREGGRRVVVDGHAISVLTPDAPLGAALLGCGEGDEAEVDRGAVTGVYEVISVG